MKIMTKELITGRMARARAERIFRRERNRPKRRRTRRARITRTMPVEVFARSRDASDITTTKASNQYLSAKQVPVRTAWFVDANHDCGLCVDLVTIPVPAIGEQGHEPVGEGANAELECKEDGEEEVELQKKVAEAVFGSVSIYDAIRILCLHNGAEEALRRTKPFVRIRPNGTSDSVEQLPP